jgi:Tfp pilus assembly protein PilO
MAIPLVKRVFNEKRRLVVPLLAALALNIGLYMFVVYPLSVRVRSMERREETAAQEMLAAEREDGAARALLQGRDRTGTALGTFYKDVLPTSLSNARDVTFLRLEELGEKYAIRIKRRNAVTDKDKTGSLARLRITTELEGNYENIRRFIYQLESGSNFVVIDSVQLAQDPTPGAPLALTLGLSTYYRTEPHGA